MRQRQRAQQKQQRAPQRSSPSHRLPTGMLSMSPRLVLLQQMRQTRRRASCPTRCHPRRGAQGGRQTLTSPPTAAGACVCAFCTLGGLCLLCWLLLLLCIVQHCIPAVLLPPCFDNCSTVRRMPAGRRGARARARARQTGASGTAVAPASGTAMIGGARNAPPCQGAAAAGGSGRPGGSAQSRGRQQ